MADLTIRNLDDALIVRLKRRAWFLGVPFEEAVRLLVIASVENDTDEVERVPMPQPSNYAVDGEIAAWRIPLHS